MKHILLAAAGLSLVAVPAFAQQVGFEGDVALSYGFADGDDGDADILDLDLRGDIFAPQGFGLQANVSYQQEDYDDGDQDTTAYALMPYYGSRGAKFGGIVASHDYDAFDIEQTLLGLGFLYGGTGGFAFEFQFGEGDLDVGSQSTDLDYYLLELSYEVSPALTVYFGAQGSDFAELDDITDDNGVSRYALGVEYQLGGGAGGPSPVPVIVTGEAATIDAFGQDDINRFSLGVRIPFGGPASNGRGRLFETPKGILEL